MGSNLDTSASTQRPTIFRWSIRRRISLRRRRLPTARLGGKKARPKFVLARLLGRVGLRILKLKNLWTLKKLKDYYHALVRDIIEGGGSVETYQQRLSLETSLGIPVMGLSFNNFP